MCGILGTSRLNERTRPILQFLTWEMQSRGRDSWGASDGVEMIHQMGDVLDGPEAYYLPNEWERVIVHTRAASGGSAKSLENAHPFQFFKPDGTSIIGI